MRLTKRNYDNALEGISNAEAAARKLLETIQSLCVKAAINRRQDPVAYLVLQALAGDVCAVIDYTKWAKSALAREERK